MHWQKVPCALASNPLCLYPLVLSVKIFSAVQFLLWKINKYSKFILGVRCSKVFPCTWEGLAFCLS